jgi:hypothetical protein
MTARRRQQLEAARAAAVELGAHLHHRNIDALTKVARNTLENIKRRITTSNVVFYGDGEYELMTLSCDENVVVSSADNSATSVIMSRGFLSLYSSERQLID